MEYKVHTLVMRHSLYIAACYYRSHDIDGAFYCYIVSNETIHERGQFIMNTCGQYVIEERYLPRNLSM